jgi:hypothetical protein
MSIILYLLKIKLMFWIWIIHETQRKIKLGMHRLLILPDIRSDLPLNIQIYIKIGNKPKAPYWRFSFPVLCKINIAFCTPNKYRQRFQEDTFWNDLNWYGYHFNFPGYLAIFSTRYPVSGRISGKSNPVSGLIPDRKKGRIIRPGIRCIPRSIICHIRIQTNVWYNGIIFIILSRILIPGSLLFISHARKYRIQVEGEGLAPVPCF